jgi:uncharacterized protein (TIGR02246 family)
MSTRWQRCLHFATTTQLLALAACGPGTGLSDADRAAIHRLDSTYVSAWLRDDTTAVLATLAPDAVLMPSGQRPLTDLEAIRGFWWPVDGSRTRITAYTTTIDELGGGPDLAYARGTGQLAFSYEKDTMRTALTSSSMTLTILRRGSNGRWRIARRMWGPLAR